MNIGPITSPASSKPPKNIQPNQDDARDNGLLQRIANKDREAFEQLYQQYHPRLIRFVSPILRDCPAASSEEVTNDTMFVVWRRSAEFRGDSKVSTWIFGIAYRTALSERKKHLAKCQNINDIDPDQVNQPCKEQQQVNLHNLLATAMNLLSLEHQTVVKLTFWDGFSYAEIAKTMDCPVNTVKSRMHYAKSKLKDVLPGLLGENTDKLQLSDIFAPPHAEI